MDFTPEKYEELLESLLVHGRFSLMHDVDARPNLSIQIATREALHGIKSTYYFRAYQIKKYSAIIHTIKDLGHTIGYHYECLAHCRGDISKAYENFNNNLAELRKIAPVQTACAHGSPWSHWNNKDLWNQHNIRALGINYEPMLDTDFSTTLYLTDTGRRWDGYSVSVRDKVPKYQKQWKQEGLEFHSTDDIIHAINNINHPIHTKNLLINTHPQRWMPFGVGWIREATLQRAKNTLKKIIVSTR